MVSFRTSVLLLVLGFLLACGSTKRDPVREIEPIGGGCFGPKSEIVKLVPVECARRGKVTPAALQKCVLGSLGQRCGEYNVRKPACIQACVEHVKRTKF